MGKSKSIRVNYPYFTIFARRNSMTAPIKNDTQMRPIQMVDTRSQYHKIKNEIDKAVLDVMESTAFINGKAVQDFAVNLSSV